MDLELLLVAVMVFGSALLVGVGLGSLIFGDEG